LFGKLCLQLPVDVKDVQLTDWDEGDAVSGASPVKRWCLNDISIDELIL
jgi:hypothetical protein